MALVAKRQYGSTIPIVVRIDAMTDTHDQEHLRSIGSIAEDVSSKFMRQLGGSEGLRKRSSMLLNRGREIWTNRDFKTHPPPIEEMEYPGLFGKLPNVIKKLEPLVVRANSVIDHLQPVIEKLWMLLGSVWAAIQPYHPEEFGQAIFGLFICFFGGHYVLTLAAIEAYRVCGWEKAQAYLTALYEDFLVVKKAYDEDNRIDSDGDGVADVNQISGKMLLSRKIQVVITTCDPEIVSGALSGLWTGFMGVVATLRVQFAEVVMLGAAIGDVFREVGDRFGRPVLQRAIPPEYHKWLPVLIRYSARCIGVSLAWMVQRGISSFYSSIRGAQLCVRGIILFLARNSIYNTSPEAMATSQQGQSGGTRQPEGDAETRERSLSSFAEDMRQGYHSMMMRHKQFRRETKREDGSLHVYECDESSVVFSISVCTLAAAGFAFQIYNFFGLPIIFAILLFPLTCVEYLLTWYVAVEDYASVVGSVTVAA